MTQMIPSCSRAGEESRQCTRTATWNRARHLLYFRHFLLVLVSAVRHLPHRIELTVPVHLSTSSNHCIGEAHEAGRVARPLRARKDVAFEGLAGYGGGAGEYSVFREEA